MIHVSKCSCEKVFIFGSIRGWNLSSKQKCDQKNKIK